ncbi:MAG: hypothetical protein CMH26_06400 [Micavibrio sp.]|nr:hypothetical protein [Micavibrio sp.]|tara:strand:+ start:2712 stop:2936 length:225 start_codon:yes stop_codon:yes gene_type:complete
MHKIESDTHDASILLCDKEVARLLGMSAQWVRAQRHKRRKGLEHNFTIDPVMIGSSPRYRRKDINDWLGNLPTG